MPYPGIVLGLTPSTSFGSLRAGGVQAVVLHASQVLGSVKNLWGTGWKDRQVEIHRARIPTMI